MSVFLFVLLIFYSCKLIFNYYYYINKMKNFVVILFLFITFNGYAAPVKLTACGHHDYAPWNWKSNNEIIGACAEVTKTLFAKLGVEVDLTFIGPWKRCQNYIASGKIDINICAFKNARREKYSVFTEVPMGVNENAVFIKKGNKISFNQWDDLQDKVAGMVLGVSIGEEFDNFLAQHVHIERVRTFVQNFQKLAVNRVDFIPTGRFSGKAMLHAFELSDKIVDLPHPILAGKLYISMSKKSKYLYLLPKIDKMLKNDGYNQWVDSLLEKYIHTYKMTYEHSN